MGVEVKSGRVLITDRVVETIFTKQSMQVCIEGFNLENIWVSWGQGYIVEIVIASNKVVGEQGKGSGSRECDIKVTECTLLAIERIVDNFTEWEVTEYVVAV